MRARACALVAILLAATCAAPARATTITMSPSSDGGDCDLVAQPFMPFTTYIVVRIENDEAAGGITGAEWRIDGWDPSWFTTGTPADNNDFPIGTPTTTGWRSAFATCRPGPVVLLFTVQTIALAPVSPRIVHIVPHVMPSNPQLACVNVTLCDAPVFTGVCVCGGEMAINQVCDPSLPCLVGVESATWSGVKRLFE